MVNGYKMSLTTKKKEIKKLIEDGKELKFSEKLMNDYKAELSEIETKLQEIKEERERFKLHEAMREAVN